MRYKHKLFTSRSVSDLAAQMRQWVEESEVPVAVSEVHFSAAINAASDGIFSGLLEYEELESATQKVFVGLAEVDPSDLAREIGKFDSRIRLSVLYRVRTQVVMSGHGVAKHYALIYEEFQEK